MKLKELRDRYNLKLKDLSYITGLSISKLSRIESKSDYDISLKDALILVNYFPELSLEDLNNGKVPPYPSVSKLSDATKSRKVSKVH